MKETFVGLCRARFCDAASAIAARVEAALAGQRCDQSRPNENAPERELGSEDIIRFQSSRGITDDEYWSVHQAFLIPKIGRPSLLSDFRSIAVINSAKKLYLRMLCYGFEECLPTNLGIIGGLGVYPLRTFNY